MDTRIKAYDRVEWSFLEKVMRKMGFAEHWIKLFMTCVKLATYSVLVNGTPFGLITPTRGLQQGDPLTLYVFLLCAEGLSSMLRQDEVEGKITGIPIATRGYKLSHLFFAGGSLLFCWANFTEWCYLQHLLQLYEKASS